jgi:hypothetical protein
MYLEGPRQLLSALGAERRATALDTRKGRLSDACSRRELCLRHLLEFSCDAYSVPRGQHNSNAGCYVPNRPCLLLELTVHRIYSRPLGTIVVRGNSLDINCYDFHPYTVEHAPWPA